jgi:uncharacterized protein YehS (DUF1456 family)
MEIRATCPVNGMVFIPERIWFTETSIELECNWQKCPDSDCCDTRDGLIIKLKGGQDDMSIS